jgi:tRNA (cmo5U34)-methyltransferase
MTKPKKMAKPKKDFSFGDHAPGFDSHIRASIPGYKDGLLPVCVGLSRRFVQSDTKVIDVGCSTGHLLASIQKSNSASRASVQHVGLDCEAKFGEHWKRQTARNLEFRVCDARTYEGFENVSLALSLFTIQFIRSVDKLPLLSRIHAGLVDGGALIIAEKTLAETARLQDALTFPYYDFKLERGFTPEQILDKERSLRGQMTLWTETELRAALNRVGFREIEPIWRSFMFVGLLALK